MVYDQPTQVTLECPQCRSYKTIPRRRDIPFAVRVPTDKTRCRGCLSDSDRLREDRDERRRIFGEF